MKLSSRKILAIPKGRINNEVIPLIESLGIKLEEDFYQTKSRKNS